MGMRVGGLAAALLGVLLLAAPVRAATQQEVEESLTCQCGCGLTVHSCNHLQCPSGEPMKKDITERLARGEGKETILAAFRTRYGEKVLSSPTFRGFNWLAWITPFAVVGAGAVGLTLVIRRWARAPAPVARVAPGPASVADAERRQRLARELDDYEA
ncbi:MAG TPA: cytochrome c-type biogenesis protein CcmH [Candidatus Binatus sp.]|nr:cytochrome c-type biogenesis protein CcmH [Candidatus Binatus sp.]